MKLHLLTEKAAGPIILFNQVHQFVIWFNILLENNNIEFCTDSEEETPKLPTPKKVKKTSGFQEAQRVESHSTVKKGIADISLQYKYIIYWNFHVL